MKFNLTPSISKLTRCLLSTGLITSALTATSVNAEMLPSETAHLNPSFKIAIVGGAAGSHDINKGNYKVGIDKISAKAKLNDDDSFLETTFATSMGLCVANMKLERFNDAKSACSKAIKAIEGISGQTSHSRYLTSIAYSNRAIVNHYLGDKVSAYKDISRAMKVDSNYIVKANAEALNKAIIKKELLAKL